MRVLLDTHVAIWTIQDDKRLSREARRYLRDANNTFFVSIVSLWEIGIKYALKGGGRKGMPVSAEKALERFQATGFQLLSLTPAHVIAFESGSRQHGDPFDLMLIAQARSEPMRLMTHDERVAAYSDTCILV